MEEEKILNNRKKIIIISASIVLLLALIVGVSYAYWQRTKVQEDTNVVASACFGVSLEGNEAINLSSLYPTTIEEGMSYTPYTFTITNICSGESTYIVNLESLAETTFLNTSIRVALDDTNKLYSEYREGTKYYSDSKESRTLISGTLESNGSVTYNLRMWIDEKTPTTEQNKIFASKIVVLSGEEGELIDPLIENLETTSTLESINITYQTNGDVVPVVCKYGLEEGNYTNTITSATTSNCKITGLTPETTYYYQVCTTTGKGEACKEGSASTNKQVSGECPEGKICIEPISSKVNVGDYISMTPTSTSYTLPNELSGCDGTESTCIQNELNPSELNLWRVIRLNEDGTMDMVSDKVSSTEVYFYGRNGYMNLVGGLNTIAAQYLNKKYVQKTRHIGYSNQTELCNSKTYQECLQDEGYKTDTDLVKTATGTLVGIDPSGSITEYWLASRVGWSDTNLGCRYVFRSGVCGFSNGTLVSSTGEERFSSRVRPIVTIKADTQIISGDGQSEGTAYAFE